MELKYFQCGFNYSQDGPGNRLVYHLQGCNMSCPWCSNPEGMSCEKASLSAGIDEVIKSIISCSPMFFDGGGVTFTGGEASLQLEAVYKIMSAVKEKGIATAIETNGTAKNLLRLENVCDYWMMDFKHPDNEKLKSVTGVGNEIIKSNISALAMNHTVHIRIPLIHGFNDDKTALDGFAEFFGHLKNISRNFDVEILAYHEFGKEKWEKEDKDYSITDGFVTEKTIKEFSQCFSKSGFSVIHT